MSYDNIKLWNRDWHGNGESGNTMVIEVVSAVMASKKVMLEKVQYHGDGYNVGGITMEVDI